MKLLNDILTENDGVSYCLMKVGIAVVLVVYLGLTVFQVVHTMDFKYVDFATGVMQILGGGGAGLLLKQMNINVGKE